MRNRAESQNLIDIGNCIREQRQKAGMSQESLAELAGISVNTVSRIEGGQTAMSVEVFKKLVCILVHGCKPAAWKRGNAAGWQI